MNVSQLRCAAADPEWRAAFMRGESPPTKPLPGTPAVVVHGSRFHALARQLTEQLRKDPRAEQDDHDALLGRLYTAGGETLLNELLAQGQVDSASALTTAFHAFCDRLLQLRERVRFVDLFVAAEYKVADIPLDTPSGKLFVSGIVDCIRRRPDGRLEVVDYKLSAGEALDKDALQIALYRRLLQAQDHGLDPAGAIEYFLPSLQVTPFSPKELDLAYNNVVAPFLGALVAARKAVTGTRPPVGRGAGGDAGPRSQPPVADAAAPADPVSPCSSSAPKPQVLIGTSRGHRADPVFLSFEDLKRHTAVLGGSGSGKTTLALNLVEQALCAGIPALFVDRKGDLARYADPAAWQERDDPARDARRRALRERLDIRLYTPGHSGGRPLQLTLVPGVGGLDERDRQQLLRTGAQALGEMLNLKQSAADGAKRGVLKEAFEVLCKDAGGVSVSEVVALLASEEPAFRERLGVLAKQVDKLLMQLKSFELMNPELLTDAGEPLDVEVLLGLDAHAVPGKTRLCIVNTRFFDGEAAALFWVSQLLGELNRLTARRPSKDLQALVLFDEADLYLPAMRTPVTKGPMESLLKRARSAGLGILLATQSPGDFDYKCRENVLSWLVGRVKETRAIDKLRPLAASAGVDAAAAFPKQAVGQFHMLTESTARPLLAQRSLLNTEQLSERRILELARLTKIESP